MTCERVFGRVLDALHAEHDTHEDPTPTTAASAQPQPVESASAAASGPAETMVADVEPEPWWVADPPVVPDASTGEPANAMPLAPAASAPVTAVPPSLEETTPAVAPATRVAASAAEAPADVEDFTAPAPWWEVTPSPTPERAPSAAVTAVAAPPPEVDEESTAPAPWWATPEGAPPSHLSLAAVETPSPAAAPPQTESLLEPAPWWAATATPAPMAGVQSVAPASPTAYSGVGNDIVFSSGHDAFTSATVHVDPTPTPPPPARPVGVEPPPLAQTALPPTRPPQTRSPRPPKTVAPAKARPLVGRATRIAMYSGAAVIVVLIGLPAIGWMPLPGGGVAPVAPTTTATPESAAAADAVTDGAAAPETAVVPAAQGAPSPTPAKPAALVAKPAAPAVSTQKGKPPAAPAPKKASSDAAHDTLAMPVQQGFAVARAEATPVSAPEPADVPESSVLGGPVYELRQVDTRPLVESQVAPSVPDHLRTRAVQDVVILRVRVSTAGRASDVQVLRRSSVDPALDGAAVAAVKKWRFQPARKRGQAVNCWLSVGVPMRADAQAGNGGL